MITNSQIKQAEEIFGIKPQRTLKQNRSLHLALTMLSDQLNLAGLDVKKVIKVDIPWTPATAKEYLFRPIMKAMLNKESTTELNTKQVSDIWELLLRELGEKVGIEYIPFPSEEQTAAYLQSLQQSNH